MKGNWNKILISICILVSFNAPALLSQSKLNIIDKTVNFGMRTVQMRNIDVIIVHSVYNDEGGNIYDIDLIIKEFSHYHVSSHYVIGRDGTIYQLVNEKNIAFHAGNSKLPDGRRGVNAYSIGIEVMDSIGDSPAEVQIRSLTALVKDIENRYVINYVLRHSDIAPGRKTDPWNMDWKDFMKRIGYMDPVINMKIDSMFNLKIDSLFKKSN